VAGHPTTGAEALASAQAGIAEALVRMSAPGSADYAGEGASRYRPGWGVYLVANPGDSGLDPEYERTTTDGLDNDGDGESDEVSEHYPETASTAAGGTGRDRDTPWTLARYKLDGERRVVFFGDHDDDPATPPIENPSRGVPKLIVTAAGRSGAGWKLVTVEAVKWPLPTVPAALYVEGALGFTGTAFRIDGRDHGEPAPHDTIAGAPSVPGIATPTDARAIAQQLVAERSDAVRGEGGDPSVRFSRVNLDLNAIATAWSRIADVTLDGGSGNAGLGAWDDTKTPKVVHVRGDFRASGPGSGSGVLVVEGDLELSGAVEWTGLIICLRNARLGGEGRGPSVIGSILVQGTVAGRSEVAGRTKVLYSSSVLRRIADLTRYEVSSWIDQ
jgi:hypothetical protein